MKHLNLRADLCCSHGGRVVLPIAAGHSYLIEGSDALLASDLEGAPIEGCPQSGRGIERCKHVTTVLTGVVPDLSVDGGAPVDESVLALTDGCPPGLVRLVAPPPTCSHSLGALVPAPMDAREGAEPPRATSSSRPASAAHNQSPGLDVSLLLDLSEVDSVASALPTRFKIHVRVLQESGCFECAVELPRDGQAVRLETGLDARLESWVFATNNPFWSQADDLTPTAVSAPCVAPPRGSPVRLRPGARDARWRGTWSEILADEDPRPPWPIVARANGLPFDDPRKLPAWSLVRLPVHAPARVRHLELELRPTYPLLLSLDRLTPSVARPVEALCDQLATPTILSRVELAAACVDLEERSGRSRLGTAFRSVPSGPRIDRHPQPRRRLHSILLDAFRSQVRERVPPVEDEARRLRDAFDLSDTGWSRLQDESRALARATPMHLSLCGPRRARIGEPESKLLRPYLHAATQQGPEPVVHAALSALTRFRQLVELLDGASAWPAGHDGLLTNREAWDAWFSDAHVRLQDTSDPVDPLPGSTSISLVGCAWQRRIADVLAATSVALFDYLDWFEARSRTFVQLAVHRSLYIEAATPLLELRLFFGSFLVTELNAGQVSELYEALSGRSDLSELRAVRRKLRARSGLARARGRLLQFRGLLAAFVTLEIVQRWADSNEPVDRDFVRDAVEVAQLVSDGANHLVATRLNPLTGRGLRGLQPSTLRKIPVAKLAQRTTRVLALAAIALDGLDLFDEVRTGNEVRGLLFGSSVGLGVLFFLGVVSGPVAIAGLLATSILLAVTELTAREKLLRDFLRATEFGDKGLQIDGHPFRDFTWTATAWDARREKYLEWPHGGAVDKLRELHDLLRELQWTHRAARLEASLFVGPHRHGPCNAVVLDIQPDPLVSSTPAATLAVEGLLSARSDRISIVARAGGAELLVDLETEDAPEQPETHVARRGGVDCAVAPRSALVRSLRSGDGVPTLLVLPPPPPFHLRMRLPAAPQFPLRLVLMPRTVAAKGETDRALGRHTLELNDADERRPVRAAEEVHGYLAGDRLSLTPPPGYLGPDGLPTL
ncbi:MAG: hypothetical protein GY711_15065 [bacterium]|nr:hypothetical protein [bacterium]